MSAPAVIDWDGIACSLLDIDPADVGPGPEPLIRPTSDGRYRCPACGHRWRTTSSAVDCCAGLGLETAVQP